MHIVQKLSPVMSHILGQKELPRSITTLQFFREEDEEETICALKRQKRSKVHVMDSEQGFRSYLADYCKKQKMAKEKQLKEPRSPEILILMFPTTWKDINRLLRISKRRLLSAIYLLDYSLEASSYADQELVIDEYGKVERTEGSDILSLF